MIRSRRMISIFMTILWFQSVVLGADDLKSQFLSEAPKGWQRQKSFRDVVKFDRRETQTVTIDGKAVEDAKTEIVVKSRMDGPEYAIECFSYKADSPLRFAFVNGKDYAFELKRQVKTGPLLVKQLGSEEKLRELIKKGTYSFRALGTPYELWAQDLESLLKSPGFQISKIEQVRENDIDLVRVQFECQDKNLPMQFSKARIDLDPKNDWAVKSAEFNATDQLKIKIHHEYEVGKNGEILPKLYSYSKFVPSEKYNDELRFDFGKFEFESTKESYFKLSNFGLPEPEEFGSVPKGGMLQYWIILSAFVFLGLAFYLNRSARPVA